MASILDYLGGQDMGQDQPDPNDIMAWFRQKYLSGNLNPQPAPGVSAPTPPAPDASMASMPAILKLAQQKPSSLTMPQPMGQVQGPQQPMGILDRLKAMLKEPGMSRSLLAAGAQLIQAGGPSSHPTSTLQAVGQGLQAGTGAFDDYQNQQLQRQAEKIRQEYDLARIDALKKGKDPTLPASIQEWTLFDSMTPEKQREYLQLKRNVGADYQIVDVNGVPTVVYKPAAGAPTPSGSGIPLKTSLTTLQQHAAGENQLNQAKASGTALGEKQGGAEFDLPRVEQNAQIAIDTLDKLASHPGLKDITGLKSLVPVVPGTRQAGADALAKEVEGQTFLNAYNALRGGGSITETEGAKATASIARLQRSQSTADYQAALRDLKAILQKGLERARQQASKGAPAQSTPAAINWGDLP